MRAWELGPGRLMVDGVFSDLALHHHPAVQITFGGQGSLAVTRDDDTNDECRVVVIARPTCPTGTSTSSASAAGSPRPQAKPPGHCGSGSRKAWGQPASGEPVNLSGLATSHSAQTFPSRTVMAMIRGIISRYPSLAGTPGV